MRISASFHPRLQSALLAPQLPFLIKPLRFAALLAGLVAVVSSASAQTKVESLVLAPEAASASNISVSTISKSGLHGLTVVPKGSRFVVLMDGVEGPRFDRRAAQSPVVTDDGRRHAYAAIAGTEAIMVIDGKEVGRAPAKNGQSPFQKYGFSKTGKRSWFTQLEVEKDRNFYERLVVDGQPAGDFAGVGSLVFSPDESRYAVLVTKHLDRREFLVVDGKDVGFQGDSPQFSPDGKNVLTIGRPPDQDVLIINGRQASRAPKIHSVHMSTGGLNLLVLSPSRSASGDQAQFLGTGGKKIEGSESVSIDNVTFSPDGKRYAALCTVGLGKKFLLLDGKRGQIYDQILDFQFSADSAKAYYIAVSGGKQFFVTGEDESDGYQTVQPVVLSADGKHVGCIGRLMGSREAHVVIDGKVVTTPRDASLLGLSADGSRYGFQGGNSPNQMLYLDGVEQKGVAMTAPNLSQGGREGLQPIFAFSPDGKHVAYQGFVNSQMADQGLVLNGKLVDPKKAIWNVPLFTPDSRHMLYFRAVAGGGYELVVDGAAAVKFTAIPIFMRTSGIAPFELGADGVFTFLGEQDGALKRFRVTPGADTSIAAMMAGVEAAGAKQKK